MLNLLSSICMEESRNISHKHMISISLTFMQSSMRDNLVNSWAARPFKFQWQNWRVKHLRGSGLDSISPYLSNDQSKRFTYVLSSHLRSAFQLCSFLLISVVFLCLPSKMLFKSPTLPCNNWLFIAVDKKLFQNSTIKYQ